MSNIELEAFEKRICYLDNHLIFVNKLPGELSQGDDSQKEPLPELVKHYLKMKFEKPGEVYLGVIHRLDQPVSGLLAFARTSKAMERMSAQFRERQVRKLYIALSHRALQQDAGVQSGYLRKDSQKNLVQVFAQSLPNTQFAQQRFAYLGEHAGAHSYAVEPATGRPHQIRVLMAHAGAPLLGDVKYGGQRAALPLSLGLHSLALEFTHPTLKERKMVSAPLSTFPFEKVTNSSTLEPALLWQRFDSQG